MEVNSLSGTQVVSVGQEYPVGAQFGGIATKPLPKPVATNSTDAADADPAANAGNASCSDNSSRRGPKKRSLWSKAVLIGGAGAVAGVIVHEKLGTREKVESLDHP